MPPRSPVPPNTVKSRIKVGTWGFSNTPSTRYGTRDAFVGATQPGTTMPCQSSPVEQTGPVTHVRKGDACVAPTT